MTTEPEENPTPTVKKLSRLAVTSLVLAVCTWVFLLVRMYVLTAHAQYRYRIVAVIVGSWPLFLAFALILGVVAFVSILRSRGQLVGKGFAVVGILLSGILLVHPLRPVQRVTVGHNWTRVLAAIQNMRMASDAYYKEYGRWPQPRSSGDLVLVFNGLVDPLTGKDVDSTRPDLLEQNPRLMRFMDFRIAHLSARGLTGTDEFAFHDSWGTPYGFAFDNGVGGVYYLGPGTNNPVQWRDDKAGDGMIPEPFATTNAVPGVIRAGCAFFSNGPDGRTGTSDTCKDDIRSWK